MCPCSCMRLALPCVRVLHSSHSGVGQSAPGMVLQLLAASLKGMAAGSAVAPLPTDLCCNSCTRSDCIPPDWQEPAVSARLLHALQLIPTSLALLQAVKLPQHDLPYIWLLLSGRD